MFWIALQPRCEVDEAPALCSALAWWALQFTPRVLLQEEAVLLELSGSERLFGGRSKLLRQVLRADPAPVRPCWAQGDTALLALARLRLRHMQGRAALQVPPDALPLPTLSAARAHLPTLTRLGCNTWGQLRALPRGGVVRRFGAALLDALDRAYGLRSEIHTWLVLPEVFDARLELHALVESAPALMFAGQRLLVQLQAWLQARQSGVLALQWTWLLDERRSSREASVGAGFAAGPLPRRNATPFGGSEDTPVPSVGAGFAAGPLPRRNATPSGLSPAAPSLLSRVGQGEETQASGLGLSSEDTPVPSVGAGFAAGPLPRRNATPFGGSEDTPVPSVGATSLLIRTAEPTRDIAHLARLSAEQLARRTLSAPAHTLCLQSVEVQPLPTASASLLMEEQRQGDSLHQLVERLAARLGPQQVLCLRPQADHRPEHMQLLCEASSALPLLAGSARLPARSAWDDIDNTALYPSWLLRTPLRLALQDNRPLYQGPLQLLVGPQRLEVLGWPQVEAPQAVLRDYFIALSPHAGLLWVYRERLPPALPGAVATPAWYLHGIYA